MNVRQLMELLATEPPDREIIVARDAEGNGYKPLVSVEVLRMAERPWGYEHDTLARSKAPYHLVLWP